MSHSHCIAPGPRGHFLLGSLPEFRRDPLGLVMRCAANYGNISRVSLGPQVVHLLNHPDLIGPVLRSPNYDKRTRSSASITHITQDSLLTLNGEAWKRQRRMDQPAFHHRQIAGFAEKMTAATAGMLESWRGRRDFSQPVDIASEMTRLTYTIVCETLFSFNTAKDAAAVEQSMRAMLPFLFARLGRIVNLPLWVPTPGNRRFRQSLATVDEVVYRIIAGHREALENGAPHNDLLAMLMQARHPDTGAALSDTQLRNETITFLLAGHETTANALAWIFHLVSRHPETTRQLVAEIDSVLGGRIPALEDVPKLALTKRVIQEAMRLYPPIWIIERRVIAADEIRGFHIPAGSSVVISPYALHRHPEFWHRPEDFDPSRFESPAPPAYLPFSEGPRFCIGNEFAMLEAHLIVAMVLQAFRLEAVPGHAVEALPDITLRPRHGVRMTLYPR